MPHLRRAAAACRPGGVTDDVTGWRGPGSGDGERVFAEFGQDVADLADELAGLRQGGDLAVGAVLNGRVVVVAGADARPWVLPAS